MPLRPQAKIGMPGRIYISGSGITKNLFTGKEHDSETNWDYFGARYYNPAIGRWLALDPLEEKFPEWSPYNYTLNNPINNFDPDGKEVRFEDEEEANKLKDELNKLFEDANIIVTKNDDGQYILGIGEGNFDWSQDKVISALNDVITSTETIFNVEFTETHNGKSIQSFGGGKLVTGLIFDDSNPTVKLSPRGYVASENPKYFGKEKSYAEPIGVVFMHEAVGHGHPVGNTFGNKGANGIQAYFNKRNGTLFKTPSHFGYGSSLFLGKVKWKSFRKHPGVEYK